MLFLFRLKGLTNKLKESMNIEWPKNNNKAKDSHIFTLNNGIYKTEKKETAESTMTTVSLRKTTERKIIKINKKADICYVSL